MSSGKQKRTSSNKCEKSLVERFTGGVKAAAKTFLSALKPVDPHNPYKLLLIGETGSGKTSFLNLLYNCGMVQALGCGFGEEALERFRKFNNIALENAQSIQMESKTSDAQLYNVELGDLKVGIIDTPGFGDSRGLKQDAENTEKIIEVLREEDYINCVCLIINGRQSRTSASLRYVLTEITAILPKEILDNVIVVFSNTSDPLDLNFDPKTLTTFFGREVIQEHIFFVENPYCRFEKAKTKIEQLGAETVAKSLKKSFEDTAKVLTTMCDTVKDFQQVHTHRFVVLYEKKQEVEKGVLRLLTAYENQVNLENALKTAKEEVDAAVNTKSLNENFTSTQRFPKIIQVETASHNTLCGAKGCHSNCHEECSLPKSFDKAVFKNCRCMADDLNCRVCGHGYSLHYHEEVLFKTEDVVEQLVDEEMQEKFKQAASAEERADLLYKKLERQIRNSQKKRERLSEELQNKIEEFQKMGVARNYAMLIENQLAVIDTHLEGTTGPETHDLRETKEKLEKKLKLVQEALQTRPSKSH